MPSVSELHTQISKLTTKIDKLHQKIWVATDENKKKKYQDEIDKLVREKKAIMAQLGLL